MDRNKRKRIAIVTSVVTIGFDIFQQWGYHKNYQYVLLEISNKTWDSNIGESSSDDENMFYTTKQEEKYFWLT